MAVSIDSVYQKVLAIINKEQRGYITPLEFNLLAEQAQIEIFEDYFDELEQLRAVGSVQGRNSSIYGDGLDALEEKIAVFEDFNQDVTMGSGGIGTLPTHHKLGELYYNNSSRYTLIDRISQSEAYLYQNAPLATPDVNYPVYINTSATQIQVYPTTITSGVTCNIITKPTTPKWGYVLVPTSSGGNEQPLHDSSTSVTTNFELHASEETNLVYKILELSGIIVNKPGIVEIASAKSKQLPQAE